MPTTEAAIQAHKLYELKKKAVLYYQANGVPAKMESVLNDMFYDQPGDVFGYLSEYFRRSATPPKISRVVGSEIFDSRGVSALEVSLFCTYKNKEELFAQLLWPTEVWTFEHSRAEEKEEEEAERQQFLEAAISLINNEFGPKLVENQIGCEDVRKIDALLGAELQQLQETAQSARDEETTPIGEEEKGKQSPKDAGSRKGKSPKGKKCGKEVIIIPDEPREALYPGCNALGAISLAASLAGARSLEVDLYEYFRRLTAQDSNQLRLPLPLATLLYGGKASPGKANCVKEYMLVPKPHLPFDKVLNDFSRVYRLLMKMLSAKTGPTVSLTTEVGALNSSAERPEQALDQILDALNQLELKEDYNFVLGLAGHEIFDFEKGKYEVITGQQKAAEDLVDFYADLLARYPQIIAIIDPMRKQETEAWMKLAERVSERCLIVGDRVFHRPGRLVHEELAADFQTSGWLTRLEQRNTATDVMECAKFMRENGRKLFLASGVSDSCDSFMVDLAVGCQFDFVKIGAPCRGERSAKFARLLHIWRELKAKNGLMEVSEEESVMEFPKLELPLASTSETDLGSEPAAAEAATGKSGAKKK